MNIDSRGGGNRKKIDKHFFKKYVPKMSYVLGLMCADGAVEDVRKSSRTCYFTITSKDYSLISQIKTVLNSSHKIYIKRAHFQKFKNGTYLCSKNYILRVGSKEMCQDIIDIGVRPRKSLRIRLPKITDNLFEFYLRGYFDGDGCVNVGVSCSRELPEIKVIFSSGCKKYLEQLSLKLSKLLSIKTTKVNFDSGVYRLRYHKSDSMNILKFMYKDLKKAPFLERKYNIYQNYLKNLNVV